MSEKEYLGDGVYAEESNGMIKLTGNAHGEENVIYLESSVYASLELFARRVWTSAPARGPTERERVEIIGHDDPVRNSDLGLKP